MSSLRKKTLKQLVEGDKGFNELYELVGMGRQTPQKPAGNLQGTDDQEAQTDTQRQRTLPETVERSPAEDDLRHRGTGEALPPLPANQVPDPDRPGET